MLADKLALFRSKIHVAGALLICVGLIYSRAFQSIGVAFILAWPLLNKKDRLPAADFFRNPYAISLIAYFFLNLAAILYTSDLAEFQRDIIMKLPFFLLPVGLCTGATFSRKEIRLILLTFSAVVFSAGVISFVNYLLHFNYYNEQLTHSKPIPILNERINHIYYSVLLAFASFYLLYFLLKEKDISRTMKAVFSTAFIIMLVFLHTISARTGMMAFYTAVAAGIIWYVLTHRKVWVALGMSAVVISLLIAAVLLLPSLQSRIRIADEDIEHLTGNKNINDYSIAMRVAALHTAWHVFKTSPVVGVGPADIKAEMHEAYQREGSSLTFENQKLPHNEFVQTMTSLGLLGLSLLIFLFYIPVREDEFGANLLYLGFLVIVFSSMQVESILERQVGLTFFCLFYLMLNRRSQAVEAVQERYFATMGSRRPEPKPLSEILSTGGDW